MKLTTEIPNTSQLQELKFGGFESVMGNPNGIIDESEQNANNSDNKYKNKLKLPIIETILFDNGQPVSWIFTDKNGYVMRKSQKKLSKDFIVSYFIKQLRNYDLRNPKEKRILKGVTDERILRDLNRFYNLVDQKNYSNSYLFSNPNDNYLNDVDKIKFLLIMYTDIESKYNFINLLQFFKLMTENTKINSVLLVQNFVNVQCLHQSTKENEFLLSKDRLKLLTIKYLKPEELGPKKIFLFFSKPKILNSIDSQINQSNKKIQALIKAKKSKYQRRDISQGDVPKEIPIELQIQKIEEEKQVINNETLTIVMTKQLEPLLKYFEMKKKIRITLGYFTFVKILSQSDNGEIYLYHFTEIIHGIPKSEEPSNSLDDIIKKKIPNDLKNFRKYEKISDAFCFGEFCNYTIPSTFKNIKSKMGEYNNVLKIPKENRFTNRDKNHKLPFFLPIFQIKKAYDNPQLVNIVLKAYSIFPPNFDKDEEIAKIIRKRKELEEKKKMKEKQREEMAKKNAGENRQISGLSGDDAVSSFDEDDDDLDLNPENQKEGRIVSLYNPTPLKFNHINYDEMYTEKNVCENCFKIYSLIEIFLSNIDENTAQFKNLSKAKELLLRGENLKTNAYENENQINFEDNLLFQEEIQELSLKKLLKQNLLKEKLIIKQKKDLENKGTIKKIYPNKKTQKNEMDKIFSYKLNINPRVLKLNLVAEKTKNQFFNLIFREIRALPETIYQKLSIQQPQNDNRISMKLLRMHMGINSHIYNPDIKTLKKLNELSAGNNESFQNSKKMDELREIGLNLQRETFEIDKDIFLFYKNLIKAPEERKKKLLLYQKTEEDEEENQKESNSDEKSYHSSLISKHSKDSNSKENGQYSKSEGNQEDQSELMDSFREETRFSIKKELKEFPNKSQSTKKLRSMKTISFKFDNFPERNILRNTTSLFPKKKETESDVLKPFDLLSPGSFRFRKNRTSKCLTMLPWETLKAKKEIQKQEKKKKLEEFVHIPSENSDKNSNSSTSKKDNNNSNFDTSLEENKEKKVTLVSIYYDKSAELYKEKGSRYYFITTPFPMFNEGNFPVQENPLQFTRNITIEQFKKLGKFEESSLFTSAKIFVYDENTAIPYEIDNLKTTSKRNDKQEKGTNSLKQDKRGKFLIVVLNDFFDSYIKYKKVIKDILKKLSRNLKQAKCVFFNFPGQSTTMWSKKTIFNNTYYAEFFDRFLFYLYTKEEFDQTWNLILIGFGNGGNVALTYASYYENYWDFLHTIIMFNGYCDNDSFINQSMVEILKIIKQNKNPKLIEFFIKSVTVDPQALVSLQMEKEKENIKSPKESKSILNQSLTSNTSHLNDDDNPNPMTLEGYHCITKGYFYNTKINHKAIKTRIICAHSNQDSFISINNLNSLFMNKIKNYAVTKTLGEKKNNYINQSKGINCQGRKNSNYLPYLPMNNNKNMKLASNPNRPSTSKNINNNVIIEESFIPGDYDFNELKKNSNLKRKLIVIEGSHDISYNKGFDYAIGVIGSYFRFIIDSH